MDQDLVHRARSTGAALWMEELTRIDGPKLERLAQAYDAVGDAVDLVGRLRAEAGPNREAVASAVRTLAAVQSAMRVAVSHVRRDPDDDQVGIFGWLRTTTHDERIFVPRHMRIDDPLDPEEVAAAMEVPRQRLAELEAEDERREARARRFGQLKYHAKKLAGSRATAQDMAKTIEAATALVEAGMPPSSLELRELLLPIFDEFRELADTPRAFALVLREIDRHRDEGIRPRPKPTPGRLITEDVLRAADLLKGSTIVVIGGEGRVEQKEALIEAFGLGDLVWLTLDDDPTLDEIETAVARPAVSVVLQLIRWSRHRHGEASDIAERHGKPFVRIPGGVNPNAVARAVLDQASGSLRRAQG